MSTQGTLTLLTAPECHQCGHGRRVLHELAAERDFAWREISSESVEGRRMAAAAPPLRPVLYDAGGTVIGYGRLSAKRLRRQLAGRQ